jgi:hypothetical protein
VNGERDAAAERVREAKAIVGEAGIGTVLVIGGNDADRLLVRDDGDDECRQSADSARTGLVDLEIFGTESVRSLFPRARTRVLLDSEGTP